MRQPIMQFCIVFLIDILLVAAITIPIYLLLRASILMSSLVLIIYAIGCLTGVIIGNALLEIITKRQRKDERFVKLDKEQVL